MDKLHVFDVVFKTENQEITNRYVFEIYPIYWTSLIIPANGYINAVLQVSPCGHDIMSGSVVFSVHTSLSAIPNMAYSGCTTASSTTIVSASDVEQKYESMFLA